MSFTAETPHQLQSLLTPWRQNNLSIGFVATMGCLHEGHLSLIHQARKQCDKVVVSIFVNPLQFAPTEDLSTYPKPIKRDLMLCQEAGVDLVFCPTPEELYPKDRSIVLDGGELAKLYCGKSRPTHFSGVLTVVQILFHLVKPNIAFFGEKDFQQLFLVKKMCRDLWLDIDIVGMPIIRENSGIAMSSRNTYLTSLQKEQALCLHRGLVQTQAAFSSGIRCAEELIKVAQQNISQEPSITLDYIHIVNSETLSTISGEITQPARLLLAAYIGDSPRVRLIDNGVLE